MTTQSQEPIVLQSITVIELGENIASAICGKYLSALGAQVYLQNAPRFGVSTTSDSPNLLSLYLDADKNAGDAPSTTVDVVLNADLSTPRDPASPRTIRVGFSDFGTAGPLESWKSSELVTQAMTGVMNIVGETDGPPLSLGGHQIDYSVGLIAFSAIMIAAWERDSQNGSGEGQDISLSRYEAATFMEWKGRVYDQAGNRLARGGGGGPVVVAVRDGYFGLLFEEHQYGALADHFGDPRLREPRFATRSTRAQNEPEFVAIMEELLQDRTRDELYPLFQGMGMAVAPVLDSADVLQSPQYLHQQFLVDNLAAGDGARQPGLPATFNKVRPSSHSSSGYSQRKAVTQ